MGHVTWSCQDALKLWNLIFLHSKDKEEQFMVFDHGRRDEVGVALMHDAKLAVRPLKTSVSAKGAKNLLIIVMPGVPSLSYSFMSDSE